MKRLPAALLVLFAVAPSVHGQFPHSTTKQFQEALAKSEARGNKISREASPAPASDANIDVKYYKLNLSITTSPTYLTGIVTMNAVSLIGSLTSVTLDLMSAMTVDSVKKGNTQLSFAQQYSTLTITLDRTYTSGELITMDIYYRGVPGSSGFGSFTFGSHSGTPWVYTLSEPYGAKDWWPCKDTPLDKADSLDAWVTVDSTFKVGSNGALVAVVNNADGTHTYRWAERYPISTYLVSLSITNYAEFTNWFKYAPTDSMPVLNYVLPENLSAAQAQLPLIVNMLRIYSDTLGLYPFIHEKYGHSQFGWGGAMEHQTMTSTSTFDEETIAHELAHQWFGDMITCANWSNVWLNESFATYCTALYAEGMYGASSYAQYINIQMSSAKGANGSIYVHDTSDLNTLFSYNLVYAKGASVLHMLRHVIGDSAFFSSLRAYANDPRFRFGTATTEDFRQVCESVSGKQLSYFFDEWIYGENFPVYTYSWTAIPDTDSGYGYIVPIRIQQFTGTTNPAFFTMPVDFKLTGIGIDTTVVLLNNLADQTFSVHVPALPTTGQVDPDNWILNSSIFLVSVDDHAIVQMPRTLRLEQNYPNPCNPSSDIRYQISELRHVTLTVYDILGREVAMLVNEMQRPGTYTVRFDGSGLASGLYFYRMMAGQFTQTRKMVMTK